MYRKANIYSPTECSTIDANELNFSVRNGKRCTPRRLITFICLVLHKISCCSVKIQTNLVFYTKLTLSLAYSI